MKKSDLFRNRIRRIKRSSEDLSICTSKELYSYSSLINRLMQKMFAKSYLALLLFISVCSYAQNNDLSSEKKTTIFSFTPRSKKVDKVNGFAFGLGLDSFVDNSSIEKVNGINLEINPASILIFMFANPMGFSEKESVIINGLHLSTGNLYDSKINGVSLSFFNINHSLIGFSASATYSYTTSQKGFHIGGLYNVSQQTKGVVISLSNYCEDMKGFQLGLFNQSKLLNGVQVGIYNYSPINSSGLQIGLINYSKNHKGLQIGFWNINGKRSIPFVNW
ncbi:hypothetical protein [uncultured Flavobacterium sp.]|uniref:LA_2272 family surface repeat-containing protein n=1 Tax=uncultured Flavobacterium sp. TaxID=165435 RepID=UPI0030ED4CF8